MRLLTGVLLVVLASAAGCSTSDTPETDAPPADGGSYEEAGSITYALSQHDLACANLRQAPAGPEAWVCDTEAGEAVTIRVNGPEDVAAEVTAMEDATFLDDDVSMLSGVNWTLLGPDSYVEDAHAVLGGTVTPSPR